MWRLRVGKTDQDDEYLSTLNSFAGRLTWEYDPKANDKARVDFIEAARQKFTQDRQQQQNSADILYRTQFGGQQDVKRRKLPLVGSRPTLECNKGTLHLCNLSNHAAVDIILEHAQSMQLPPQEECP